MGCGSSTTVNSTVATQVRKRDFSLIDKHARKTPKKVESSFESLAEYLISPAKDDIDKARAFYVWVCEKISYDVKGLFSGRLPSCEAKDVLKTRKSVCEGFANVYHKLCMLADIECKVIHGYSKGFGHQPGDVISLKHRTDHAWNVIYVEGKWHFVESTWGSGHLDNKGRGVKRFTDFYFLTSPEHLIKAHFPYMDDDEVESRKWQLLEHPITIEQFSKAAKPEQEAMEWNLEFPDTPFQVIECNCLFDFRIYFKKNCLKRVQAALYNTSGYPQHNAVTTTHHGSYIAVHVQPKNEGEYMLRIFGNINNSTHLPMLMEYMVRYACP